MAGIDTSLVLVGMNVRPLAQSAARAGLPVMAVDAFGHQDLAPLVTRSLSLARDLGGLMPINSWHARLASTVRTQKFSALAYSGGFENYPELVAEMSRGAELLGNSADSLRAVRDPARLREAVTTVGMRTPEQLLPGAQPDLRFRWLRKPRKSGGGFGIEPWTSSVPDDREYIVQQWVEGLLGSVAFVANAHSAQVLAVTRQLSGDPAFGAAGFVYMGNLLNPQPEPALLERLEQLVTTLTRRFGLVGLNGIDFILNGDQVIVLEVNPRYSASMELVEEALGVSLFSWHVAGCRQEPIPAIPIRHDQNVFGKARVFARCDGILPDTTYWYREGYRDVPHPGQAIRASMPICTVTAVGRDEAQCYARLVTQAEAVWNTVRCGVWMQ